MYPVSPRFHFGLQHSHQVITRADLYRGGTLISSGLPVTAGQVTVDKTAATRRQCSATLVDPDGTLTPKGGFDDLAPYGNEVRLYRGIRMPADATYSYPDDELVPLGVFRLATASWTDDGTRTLQISGYDRSRQISRNKSEDPYIIGAGQNYATAIAALLTNRYPDIEFSTDWMTTTETTPLLVIDSSADPWEQATKMARAIGAELFFDVDGQAVLRPEPDPLTGDPVWTYTDGANATILPGLGKQFDDEPGYNGVVMSGESVSGTVPVRATVWDTDSHSPTYYLGPYGKVPLFETSPFVVTLTAAVAAATASLQRNIGGTERLTFSAIPNPAHEAGDIVVVRRSNVLSDICVIQSLTIPLTVSESMQVTTQQRRSAA